MNKIYTSDQRDLTHLRYYEGDTARSILQNVEIIMATPKGTVPLAMEFGVDQSYIDTPTAEARIRMIAPLREAIEEWEPRVTVKQITDKAEAFNEVRPVAEVTLNAT